ncbi:MAG: cell division protein FtsB [Francisellaceae bacterium]|nr:cell division protein FtsB [Francisellaceae bacterium]
MMISLGVILIALQWRLWYGGGSIGDSVRLNKAINIQAQEITQLSHRNQILESEIQELKQYPFAIEERARAELGLIKKDETFCQIIIQDF